MTDATYTDVSRTTPPIWGDGRIIASGARRSGRAIELARIDKLTRHAPIRRARPESGSGGEVAYGLPEVVGMQDRERGRVDAGLDVRLHLLAAVAR